MSEHLYCYEWTRELGGDTDPVISYWATYPGAAEQYKEHKVEIVFWENPNAE